MSRYAHQILLLFIAIPCFSIAQHPFKDCKLHDFTGNKQSIILPDDVKEVDCDSSKIPVDAISFACFRYTGFDNDIIFSELKMTDTNYVRRQYAQLVERLMKGNHHYITFLNYTSANGIRHFTVIAMLKLPDVNKPGWTTLPGGVKSPYWARYTMVQEGDELITINAYYNHTRAGIQDFSQKTDEIIQTNFKLH